MDRTAQILTLIGIIVAAVPGIAAIIIGRRKESANVADILTKTAMGMLEPLNLRLEENEKRIARLEKVVQIYRKATNMMIKRYSEYIEYLLYGVSRLTEQIIDLKADPCWKSDPSKRPDITTVLDELTKYDDDAVNSGYIEPNTSPPFSR